MSWTAVRRLVPLLVVGAALLAGCSGAGVGAAPGPSTPAPSTTRPAPVPGATAADTAGWGAPSWSEDFRGSSVRRSWAVYDGDGNDGTGVRRPSQVSVADGVLTQTGTADATTGGMVLGGHDAASGRWEVRVRADADPVPGVPYVVQVALFPAGVPDPSGERIVTVLSHDIGTTAGRFFLHYPPLQQDYAVAPIDLTVWHTVAVEIAPGHVTWFVDGQPWATDVNPAAQPVTSLRLGVQLDAGAPSGMIPGRLQVDWVRYHELPAAGVPVPAAPAPETGDYVPGP